MVYRVIIEKGEDSGWVVHCPAIPGCHSQGPTIEEALVNVKDAIRGCREALGESFPEPPREAIVAEVEV